MADTSGFCFVIMPFKPELHYFFLYMSQYIEDHYGFTCLRADSSIRQGPFLEKIIQYIRDAEIVIADCSGGNPNVFYELGIAEALGKKIVLVTQDQATNIPSDVRHYDFIIYKLDEHEPFLRRLDLALGAMLSQRYSDLYELAIQLFDSFKSSTQIPLQLATRERFIESVRAAERIGDLPKADIQSLQDADAAPLLLPKIVANGRELTVMREINAWISRLSP